MRKLINSIINLFRKNSHIYNEIGGEAHHYNDAKDELGDRWTF